MSDEIGTYSFLPWLRLGLANNITAADLDASVVTRATMSVELTLEGEPVEGETALTQSVSRDVALYGPGDVTGINPSAIVKVEPGENQTNFEPNYLPYIEFYEEDFPWRYTPAAPDLATHRLRPWLALIVLTDDEFKEAPVLADKPLPAFELTAAVDDVMPPANQLWAWAHVHVNKDLIKQDGVTISTDGEQASARLQTVLKANADHAYSRILSPRRLEPDKRYHAFLAPTFETGRLAGLGLDPAGPNPALFATLSAWEDYADRQLGSLYPYYKRWSFKTGEIGDFEYLVRLLKPRPPDPRLGRRDMDVQTPGSNLPGIKNTPELEGVLRLGGALKVPAEALSDADEDEAELHENWDDPFPHPFQSGLADFINLADDYQRSGDPDPLIVPPLYGRWHALSERILKDENGNPLTPTDNWLHELNLDPRFRVPAGFGTRVIEDNQEEYMDAAWEQVGDVIAANRRIRLAQLARETSDILYGKHLGGIHSASAERALTVTAPLQRRIMSDGLTVGHRVAGSPVPQAALSAPLRRIARPGDHVAMKGGFEGPLGRDGMIARLNSGEISAAPPRVTPPDLPTIDEVAEELAPDTPFGDLPFLLVRYPWLRFLILGLLLLVALILPFFAPFLALLVAAAAVGVFVLLTRLQKQAEISNAARPEGNAPEVIDALPRFPGFTLVDPVRPEAPPPEPEPGGGPDSPEAARFKVALKDTFTIFDLSAELAQTPPLVPINIDAVVAATIEGIDPKRTVPAYTFAGLTIPAHLVAINLETFVEAMAYPEFDIPMYEPLLGLSDEHFLPNIDKIPPNTITLLETNQRFIEAYMTGLNHAFASELLWREYPTDQRGSYFRQFWDPSGVIDREGRSKEELREALRDISPIHTWSRFSSLGDHDHREEQGDKENEVVLVIRGDLLKKYPNAVIYAQKARWQPEGGPIDPSLPRDFETAGPVADRLRTPLYEARVAPDITFIGFDLTAEEVQGGAGEPGDDEPGWFFVIKERPGEPRFGLDIDSAPVINTWNDLAWPDVFDPVADNGFLRVGGGAPSISLTPFPEGAGTPDETQLQHDEDAAISWGPGMNAAEIAYVLYQVPVLVAVHGSQMLRQ